MPSAPLKLCGKPGCPNRVRAGYCPEHQSPRGWVKHQAGRTTTERGYGHNWRKIRQMVASEEFACRLCGSTSPMWVCDHIIPKAKGGTDDRSNLQRLCVACSSHKTSAVDAHA